MSGTPLFSIILAQDTRLKTRAGPVTCANTATEKPSIKEEKVKSQTGFSCDQIEPGHLKCSVGGSLRPCSLIFECDWELGLAVGACWEANQRWTCPRPATSKASPFCFESRLNDWSYVYKGVSRSEPTPSSLSRSREMMNTLGPVDQDSLPRWYNGELKSYTICRTLLSLETRFKIAKVCASTNG